MTTKQEWLREVKLFSVFPRDIEGTSKLFQNVSITMGPFDESISYEAMNYSKSKDLQLRRNYFNEDNNIEGVKAFSDRVMGKKKGSVSVICHNKEKGSNKGFCLNAYTLNYRGDHTILTIQYRTTELIKKFYADMVFFRDVILPQYHHQLQIAPLSEVNIHCASLSLDYRYFPLLIPHLKTWDSLLDAMDKKGKKKAMYMLNYVINKKGLTGSMGNIQKACYELYDKDILNDVKYYLKENNNG